MLATLLYFNLGGLQIDLCQGFFNLCLHRPIPSPGSLCPSELYVYVPGKSDIAQGLYHYHGLHHDLSLVQKGPSQELLEQAIGQELGNPEVVLLLGSNLWRVVRKYADFGYRLVSLEAGHLTSNILLVSAALGLQGRVHYLFNDDLLERWLGTPSLDDTVMAIIPLYRPEHLPSSQAATSSAHTNIEDIAAPAGSWIVSSGMDLPQAARVKTLERTIRAAQTYSLNGLNHRTPQAGQPKFNLSEQVIPESDGNLLEAYQQRSAGLAPHGITPRQAPVPQTALASILTHIMTPYRCDIRQFEPTSPTLVRAVLEINSIQNMEAGAYSFDDKTGQLRMFAKGRYPVTAFHYRHTLNNATLGLAWGLFANYPDAFQQLGDRAYRIVNMEAGLVAQRICLLSALQHLFARPFCAFNEVEQDRWLGNEWTSDQPVYFVMSGYNQGPAMRFRL
jgi:SagB-type dehydrogenase family enzyme